MNSFNQYFYIKFVLNVERSEYESRISESYSYL